MAFTDPIISGEALNRTGIRSDNYVAGVSGWRIATDGSAEFDNIGVRGNLWVPTIMLNGRDLQSILDTKALGLTAFMRGAPPVTTTTEAQIIYTEFQTEPGRQYEMMLTNVANDQPGTKNCEFVLRYTQGTVGAAFPYPDNSSGIVATSGRLSQYELANIRAYHESTGIYVLRLRVSIMAYSGTVRSFGPGGGVHLGVYDVGPSRAMVGIGGSTPPTKTLKEWTHSTTVAARYKGNGQVWTPGGLPSTSMSQGDFYDGNGNYRSWAVFDSAGYTDIADLVGVPFADVLACEVYFDYDYWYFGQGMAAIGYHNKTSLGSVEQSGGVPGVVLEHYTSLGGKWIDLKAAGTGAGTFMQALQSGYFKGLMIGNYGGVEQFYRGFAKHTSEVRPALHARYYK